MWRKYNDTRKNRPTDWNTELYLRFERERTQPSRDLSARLCGRNAKAILDVGCGPANSTAVLRSLFPKAALTGIDTSPAMIEKAKANIPDAEFILKGANEIEKKYDVIFSNACLQWIPDHATLIPFLMEHLNESGILAVQMPKNAEEPLFCIIDEVAKSGRWQFSDSVFGENRVLSVREYFDILAKCASSFDIWETVYCHALPDHASLLDWVKSTRLRPYLSALTESEGDEFTTEILDRAKSAYKPTESGKVLLRFKRLFFTASLN